MRQTFTDLLVFLNPNNQTERIRHTINWQSVYQMAKEQGVLAMAWHGIQCLHERKIISAENMPQNPLKIQWALSVEKISSRYFRQQNVIAKLSEYYVEHGIQMMLLKGYGLSLWYDVPEFRECGDVDIWLYGEQRRADRIMRDEWGVKVNVDRHHHTTFVIDGIMIENHFNFLNVYAHQSNRLIERDLLKLLQEGKGVKINIGATEVFIPSPNFNALFLLRHSAVHFAAISINLRHIIDWARFIINNYNDINWQWLYATAEQYNMHRFLYGINAIAIDYFGVSQNMVLEFPRNPQLEKRILEDILSPVFSKNQLGTPNLIDRIIYRTRRWWHNRWKHRIVYKEGLLVTFITQVYSHLLKPNSLK